MKVIFYSEWRKRLGCFNYFPVGIYLIGSCARIIVLVFGLSVPYQLEYMGAKRNWPASIGKKYFARKLFILLPLILWVIWPSKITFCWLPWLQIGCHGNQCPQVLSLSVPDIPAKFGHNRSINTGGDVERTNGQTDGKSKLQYDSRAVYGISRQGVESISSKFSSQLQCPHRTSHDVCHCLAKVL